MEKNQLLKKVGNIKQLAGIVPCELQSGRSAGVAAFECYNAAGLRFTVTPGKAMDIPKLSYKGTNLSFITKNGVTAPCHFNALEGEFPYYWSGGALCTCGLANTGPGNTENGIYRTEHGRLNMCPAENVGVSERWENGTYVLCMKGDVYESSVFGANLRLSREIETTMFSNSITISDRLENLEPADEPYMLLYHMNFGYPLVDEGAYLLKPQGKVTPRYSEYEKGVADCFSMPAPVDNSDEEVFFHENPLCSDGYAHAAIINEKLGLGVALKYTARTLPVFAQWKCPRSHDYTMALEPSNSYIMGRAGEIENGTIKTLPAYGAHNFKLILSVLDGAAEIAGYKDFLAAVGR